MKTQDLIARLSADRQVQHGAPGRALALAVTMAFLVAGALMLLTVGVRPDLGDAAATWRFDFKLVVTVTLAASGIMLLRRAIYPEGLQRAPLWVMLLAPALLLAGVAWELMVLPSATWGSTALGTNWFYCMTLVPLFGIVPLALGLWALRQGAPTRPMLSGFLTGLAAGGTAATAYAAHCPDDSPLFVIAWYPIGILALGLLGALAGRRVLRW